jgi:GDP-4-dehydro-6-deoxy-D-mannose reductase
MSREPEFRVLITGGDGFVAPYTAKAILGAVDKAQILYTARRAMPPPSGCVFAELDILDADTVARTVGKFRPTHILHLAGIASRAAAEENPAAAWDVNVVATLRLAHELRRQCAGATFLFVSSSQIYDGNISGLITENSPIGPEGVYASTKAAADLALGAMASTDLRIVRFRPFNHTGPGQDAAFAFGSFAEQIAAIEAGLRPPVIKVGNLAVKRDFLDVRDVASAYAKAIALSDRLPWNSIFNLASGASRAIEELLDVMLSYASIKIEKLVDPALQRSNEIEVFSGDCGAARKALNWNPTRPIESTLREMLDCARTKLSEKSVY